MHKIASVRHEIYFARIVAVVTVVILTGCQQAGGLTTLQKPTELATATLSEVMPQPTNTSQPTPDYRDAAVYPDMLLARSDDPSCDLPCWQGLRVGVSNKSDVQSTFERIFRFDYPVNFFLDTPRPNAPLVKTMGLDVPGTEAGGYVWESGDGYFVLYSLVDQTTDKIVGIKFSQKPYSQITNNGDYQLHTVQQSIQELGQPSFVYVNPIRGGGGRIMLVYLSGVVEFAYFNSDVAPAITSNVGGVQNSNINFCLDQQPFLVEDYITMPFKSVKKADLDAVQYEWFGEDIDFILHSNEWTNITTEDLTEAAMRDKDPCIQIRIP